MDVVVSAVANLQICREKRRPSSQSFQIFEQFLFFIVRQLRAIGVPLIAVSLLPGIKKKIWLVQLTVRADWPRWWFFESYFHRIKNIVAAMKSLGTFIWPIQQIAQTRHRAVMEVRCSQPDSIQRW